MGHPASRRSLPVVAAVLVAMLLAARQVTYASVSPQPGLRCGDTDTDPKLKLARQLAERVVKVPSNELRTRLFDQLIEEARGHAASAEVVRGAIGELWEKSNRRLGAKSNLRAFKKLLKARDELDELRASTLALIRNKASYPYPFEGPGATQEAVKRFQVAQAAIDGAVAKMRSMWRKGPAVRMPTLMQEHLQLALWTRRANRKAAQEIAVSVKLPRPDLPPWVYGLPLKGEVPGDTVTLASFGRSLQEAESLALGRAIQALNEESLEVALQGVRAGQEKNRILMEFDQVRVTNEYRHLFGLQVLAWDARLFAACRQHAKYIWETGDFGHDQPTVEFATPGARAIRAGYRKRVYENCHQGSNEPFDVLVALTHSSEHHRTILLEKAAEMATARSGLAWVQNYGLDTGFQSTIQWGAWRD